MKKEKYYKLVYLDKNGNELKEVTISATNRKAAENQRRTAFATTRINDCKKNNCEKII